jgi:A/G-specific adenine glycosylase
MILNSFRFVSSLLSWFDESRRDLPWRLPRNAAPDARLDPYHVLVSESMLQQTQVSTVLPYFKRFTQQFPTIRSLADADDRQVLRLWQGLGYYSRARNLQTAARKIQSDFGGVVPDSVEALMTLPGIGRYTAGAIASIAYNRRAPILDGNVARVLCRIHRIESDPREPITREQLWKHAEQILPPEPARMGDINSALMELGATLCTPRNPQCLVCPVRAHCQACTDNVQDRIPIPKKTIKTPLLKRWTFCIQRRGRYLIERRPKTGRWAGMWQFVTLEATGTNPLALLRRQRNVSVSVLQHAGTIRHALTHRRYQFDVYTCETSDGAMIKSDLPHAWVRLADLDRYPLPRPHLKVADMLKSLRKSRKD